MKFTFAAAALIAYTAAIKNKLDAPAEACDEPLDCLAQTAVDTSAYVSGTGRIEVGFREFFNKFYGAFYDAVEGIYYDCMRNESYSYKYNELKYYNHDDSSDDHWTPKTETRYNRMDGSFTLHDYQTGETEFYDNVYGERSSTNGNMFRSWVGNGSDVKGEVYSAAAAH